jgi:von Willebrand factor type A domain-containing protein
MRFSPRFRTLVAVMPIVGLLAALVGGGTASAASKSAPGCAVASNIEGIIDDSGSMAGNDPENYRADLLEALAFFNKEKTMGASLFADSAAPLFGPFTVGPNFGGIQTALAGVTDSGVVGFGTDYDAGFSVANSHNATANARIFLSDGEPNTTPNSNLWKSPRIPAYVVGFGSADFAVLNQIASETGGPSAFAVTNASQLRTVSQIINARINCQPDPILIEKRFTKSGQTKRIGFKADGRSAQVLVSWPTVGNVFKALFGSGKGGKKSSLASVAKKKKVKVQSERGDSFLALNLSKVKGKVSFRLRAKRLLGSETATIAVIR